MEDYFGFLPYAAALGMRMCVKLSLLGDGCGLGRYAVDERNRL